MFQISPLHLFILLLTRLLKARSSSSLVLLSRSAQDTILYHLAKNVLPLRLGIAQRKTGMLDHYIAEQKLTQVIQTIAREATVQRR